LSREEHFKEIGVSKTKGHRLPEAQQKGKREIEPRSGRNQSSGQTPQKKGHWLGMNSDKKCRGNILPADGICFLLEDKRTRPEEGNVEQEGQEI